jgi:hypothetical protein
VWTDLRIPTTFHQYGSGPQIAFCNDIMKRRLIGAIIIINSLLMLAGLFVVRYERARLGAAQWTPPAPPAQVDPYQHRRARLHPLA